MVPSLDTFLFQVKTMDRFPSHSSNSKIDKVTKRTVLSAKSKPLDPLGWISPVLVQFTIFCQDVLIDGLDWDTPLSEKRGQTWETLKLHFDGLDTIKIPRWLRLNSEVQWSLDGSVDASKRAYSACKR